MAEHEVQVVAAAMEAASRPMGAVEEELRAVGDAIKDAASDAAAAAGEGPLAGALEQFAVDSRKRAVERGAEGRELAQALLSTLADFQQNDAEGAERLRTISFGGMSG